MATRRSLRLPVPPGPATVMILVGLGGCVAPSPVPLVVMPTPGKTYAVFQQDDAACRAATFRGAVPADAAGDKGPGAPADPNLAYVQCMTTKGDIVASAPAPPPAYAYAYPYAFPGYYGAYGFYDPWLYGGPGLFGGWGYRGGYRGGFRGGGRFR